MSACLPGWPTKTHADPGLKLWELARALLPPITSGARVLEIGYRDTPWSRWCLEADPSLKITAIDWRKAFPSDGIETLQGDILEQPWLPCTWDVIVGLSSFEHIGLGHYEHDPVYVDGDMRLLERIRCWLKPGGWCYFDVPYRPQGYLVDGTKYRAYDDAHLFERLGPVKVLGYTTSSVNGWIEKPTQPPTNGKPYYYVACLIRS